MLITTAPLGAFFLMKTVGILLDIYISITTSNKRLIPVLAVYRYIYKAKINRSMDILNSQIPRRELCKSVIKFCEKPLKSLSE